VFQVKCDAVFLYTRAAHNAITFEQEEMKTAINMSIGQFY